MREIPNEIIQQVNQLLHERHSQREVASRTGVSLGTVNRVAKGQRPDHAALRRRREEEKAQRCGPIHRCKECGYLVEMPCLICGARATREDTLRERRLLGFDGRENWSVGC